jgi:methyl-accepting chemotaxis protein
LKKTQYIFGRRPARPSFYRWFLSAHVRLVETIDRMPLRWKIGAAPVFALAVLLVFGAIGISAINRSSRAVSDLVSNDMTMATSIGRIDGSFRKAQADLYRLTTNHAAGERGGLTASLAQIDAELAAARQGLKDIEASDQDIVSSAEVETISKGIAQYGEAAKVVSSMLEIDFNSSISMLAPFNEHAQHVNVQLARMSAKITASAERRRAGVERGVNRATMLYAIALIIGMALLYTASELISRAIVASVGRIVTATEAVAAGEEALDLADYARHDELNAIVKALAHFREQDGERRRLADEVRAAAIEHHQSETRERGRAEAARAAREAERATLLDCLADQFDGDVSSIVRAVRDHAEEVARSAAMLQQRAEDNVRHCGSITGETREVAAGMQIVASATEALSFSTHDIAQQAKRSSQAATDVVQRVDQAQQAMTTLGVNADHIGKFTALISGIARQTQLLALNASIEAARAGVSGQGFSVVAAEVKSLAFETSKATNSISQQVGDLQNSLRAAHSALDAIGPRVEEVSQISTAVSTSVLEQAATASQIAETVNRNSLRLSNLEQDARVLDRSAALNGDAAREMRATAQILQGQFETLNDEAVRFVANIRAA